MSIDTQQIWAPKSTPKLPPDQLEDWRKTTDELRELAIGEGLSRSEVGRRADIPLGTLSPWYDGSYLGNYANINDRVRRWLAAFAEARATQLSVPAGPGFVMTPTARKLTEALLYAQTMPEFTVATMGTGVGKTFAARNYVATRPHAYLVTMRPSTAGRHAMLQELAVTLDVHERNPARLDRAIGTKLRRNGRHTLLILDEAQNLVDDAVNQLRFFNDEFGCGIALLGNEAVYRRYGSLPSDDRRDDGNAQIQRRIGYRILQRQALAADVDAILDGWSVHDAECRRLGHAIARKPGALGQLDKVLRLAHMIAVGAGQPMGADHMRKAWANRSGEELR